MAEANRDQNRVTAILGTSSVDGESTVDIYADPTTHALYVFVENAGSIGGGTQYTEGDTDATFTGIISMAEGPSNTATPLQVDSSKHLQVDIAADSASLATSANQTTIIGHIDGIEALLTTIDGDTSNLSVVGGGTEAAAIRVTIANDSTGVLSVDDNGGALTVDAVNLDIRDLSSASDSIAAVQSGTWNITNVSGTISLPTGAATSANQTTIIGHVDGIEGLLTTIDGDTGTLASAVYAEDTAAQDADPGVMVLARRQDSLTTTTSDGAYGSLKTDAEGRTWVNVGVSLPAGDNNIGNVDIASSVTLTVSATDLDIRDLSSSSDSVTAVLPANSGVDIGDVTINNASGGSAVNIQDGGNTITVDGTVSVTGGPISVTTIVPATGNTNLGSAVDAVRGATKVGVLAIGLRDDALSTLTPVDDDYVEAIRVDSTGAQWVHVTSIDSALPAGTNAIGKLAANSGVDIGDVDVTSLPGIVGTVADDSTTPGNPVMIGGTAKNFDGTTPGQISAEDDITRFITDPNRRQYVNTVHPQYWSFHSDGSTALTDQSVAADPGDNFAIFITDIVFSNGSTTAINLFFEEGSTKILGPYYLEAVSGRGMALHFTTPKAVMASTAVTCTTSASVAHSIDVSGFIARVN